MVELSKILPRLSRQDQAVALFMLLAERVRGPMLQSTAKIAASLGVRRRAVQRSIARLEALGAVERCTHHELRGLRLRVILDSGSVMFDTSVEGWCELGNE